MKILAFDSDLSKIERVSRKLAESGSLVFLHLQEAILKLHTLMHKRNCFGDYCRASQHRYAERNGYW